MIKSNNTIGILGCGWLGSALATHLIKNDYSVNGSSRSIDKLLSLKNVGVNTFKIDIENSISLKSDFFNVDVLIIATSNKNITAFSNLINTIENSKIQKVIFISSTSVYINNNDNVDECSPVINSPLIQIENQFKNSAISQTIIIRFAGLYGPNREPGHFFKSGKLIKQPNGYANMIHLYDCIGIIENIIEQNYGNQTFNACSDYHPLRREFYTEAFKKVGRSTPNFIEDEKIDYKIISNKKLKSNLKYTFKQQEL